VPLEVLDYRTDVRNVFITPEIRSRFQRLEPGTVMLPHSHDLGHEVWVVMEGEVEFEIAGERAVVRPGQMVVARVDEPHVLRVPGDRAATVYLSVTPHITPTHTYFDASGERLRPCYSTFTTRREGEPDAPADAEPLEVVASRQVAATEALSEVAAESARVQAAAAEALKAALAAGNAEGARAAVDAMWAQVAATYRSFREMAVVWNELAPRAAPPESVR
jgi:mannose-6-phosphate isomerase-like protein (cupin superfamily)